MTNPSIPTSIGPIDDLRGYISVDVSVGGAEFRFVTTHLNTFQPAQLAQMDELISSQSGTTLPLGGRVPQREAIIARVSTKAE